MKTVRLAAIGFTLALLSTVAAAQVVFYDRDGLRGRSFTADGTVDNFENHGFNDRASSAVVEHGVWEVCSDAYFRGQCVTLRPGQYPSLDSLGMNNKISSVRPVRGAPAPNVGYAPPPPAAPAYGYYPRHGERLYQADVVKVRAVVGSPEQRCWVEQQEVRENQPNVPGAIIGGVVGGVLGHQIGSGRGNDVATALGAVGGAAVGANVNRGGETYTQNVQRCERVAGSEHPQYWDVTYQFRGEYHRAQLAFAPGPTITVNERGEPRA